MLLPCLLVGFIGFMGVGVAPIKTCYIIIASTSTRLISGPLPSITLYHPLASLEPSPPPMFRCSSPPEKTEKPSLTSVPPCHPFIIPRKKSKVLKPLPPSLSIPLALLLYYYLFPPTLHYSLQLVALHIINNTFTFF